MKTCILSALLALCCIGYVLCVTPWNSGDGIVYRLDVTQDVALERPTSNHNSLPYLLIGQHPQFPNKRSLLQFENPPTACSSNRIRWAKMYVYYKYAHKASFHSVQQTPFVSRPIEVYQVKKSWNEAQATSTKRDNSNNWSQQYLGLTGNDAGPAVLDTVTVFTLHPKGFMEFDVTDAVKSWRSNGRNYGVLLRASNEYTLGRDIRFYSKSFGDNTKHAFIHVMCNDAATGGNPGGNSGGSPGGSPGGNIGGGGGGGGGGGHGGPDEIDIYDHDMPEREFEHADFADHKLRLPLEHP